MSRDPHQIAAEAQRASIEATALRDNSALQAVFTRLEKDYIARWRNAGSQSEREEIWMRLQGLDAFKGDLDAAIAAGAVAAHNTRLRRN